VATDRECEGAKNGSDQSENRCRRLRTSSERGQGE
jgi:hypothetical protein